MRKWYAPFHEAAQQRSGTERRAPQASDLDFLAEEEEIVDPDEMASPKACGPARQGPVVLPAPRTTPLQPPRAPHRCIRRPNPPIACCCRCCPSRRRAI